MNTYYNPVKTICGSNSCEEIKNIIAEDEYKRILLIVWKEAILEMDSFKSIMNDKNKNTKAICFNESNPTVEQLFEVYKNTNDFSPDMVIAVGGGSVMDVGKSLCCLYGKKIADCNELRNIISSGNYKKPESKWIGVPTTSGTGSEVTCWATIWDPAMGVKRSVESRANYALAAIVDSVLTKDMPLTLAVSSALDAVAHAVESYWAKASNVVSKALALGAIRMIMQHMDELLEGKNNARKYMAQGSMMAGLAFSNTKTTACHSISYPLTMHYNIPHGTAVSMLLAPVMKLNMKYIENLNLLFDALGVKNCDELSDRIKDILNKADIPSSLKEWNVDYEKFSFLASQGITKGRTDNNPAPIDEKTIEKILGQIWNASTQSKSNSKTLVECVSSGG